MSPAAEQPRPPQRIVSLNLCIDPIVLALVPRERITAISEVSADPNVSAITHLIGSLRKVRGTAEEVLALEPDLVLAGSFTTGPTVALLRRLGRRVESIPLATSLATTRSTIRQIAAAVGESQRGEALVMALDAELQRRRPATADRPRTIVYHINGLVSGQGSLVDEALMAAGLANGATDLQLGRGGRVDLEGIIMARPDLVTLAQDAGTYATVIAENIRHPALQALLRERPALILPMPLWICGTPEIAEAVARLATARSEVLDRHRVRP